MGQNPIASVLYLKSPSGALIQAQGDANGFLLTLPGGGENSALNQTAAAAIKVGAGRLAKIVVIAPGSGSGALTLNDCATTGAATTANELFTLGFAGLSAGQIISLDIPFTIGLVISAVPGAGAPQYNVFYD
jgi:hypothetical protein